LGERGIWLNHFTSLDPAYGGSDAPVNTYGNTIYAENYYRTSTTDISGRAVKGTYQRYLTAVQKHFAGSAHQGPHTYYFGTIDQNGTSDGWPVYGDWYGNTPDKPARDATGFYYSTIVGGPRPASGISTAFGGSAPRIDAGKTGVQWPNVDSIAVAGSTQVQAGQSLNVHFTRENRGGRAKAVVFLDTDRNPFNAGTAHNVTTSKVAQSNKPTRTVKTESTAGVAPGTYYVGVKITDANGSARSAYAQQTVTIS
jgi:hypothetical protein